MLRRGIISKDRDCCYVDNTRIPSTSEDFAREEMFYRMGKAINQQKCHPQNTVSAEADTEYDLPAVQL